jgi:hypothetical protein
VALAASLKHHKVQHLTSLTLGSNDIGDGGLKAVLAVLPDAVEQLYLHGCNVTDEGVQALRDALERFPRLWGSVARSRRPRIARCRGTTRRARR